MGCNLRGSSVFLILKNAFFISLEILIALLMPTYRVGNNRAYGGYHSHKGSYASEECEETVTTITKILPRPRSCATTKAVHPPGDEQRLCTKTIPWGQTTEPLKPSLSSTLSGHTLLLKASANQLDPDVNLTCPPWREAPQRYSCYRTAQYPFRSPSTSFRTLTTNPVKVLAFVLATI